MSAPRPRFSSRLATLLTMAGLAIGLGNVWRFPYMMGQNGGSAFVLIYLLFMVLLAAPALAAEWSLGRATRSGPLAAFTEVFGRLPGRIAGFAVLLAIFMALAYYQVIIANVFYSSWFSARHGFEESTRAAYAAGLGNHGLQYAITLAVLAVTFLIVGRGLHRGIEAVNRLLVPAFALMAAYLVFVSLSLDGALDRLAEFARPDFSAAGPSVWFAAMGQACFSVGISGALGVMFGSYLRDRAGIPGTALTTSLLDTGAALLAMLFIVPAVLVFGIDLAAGPTLLFETLPRLFGVMPGGSAVGAVFLAGWGLTAILTTVGVADTLVGSLAEVTGGARRRRGWAWIIIVAQVAVITPIAFNPQWIGTLDLVFGSGMFMLGALLAVLGAGWGLGRLALVAQLRTGWGERAAVLFAGWIRYVVPAALIAILAGYGVSLVRGA